MKWCTEKEWLIFQESILFFQYTTHIAEVVPTRIAIIFFTA